MTSAVAEPAVQGLSEAEAARRLRDEGFNELASARPRSLWGIAGSVLREPMFLLLVAAGALYLLLGDLVEALVLLASIFVIIGITFYQERKTERALEALRELSSPRALVIREGRPRRIAGREVVRGDLVVLAEGDRVPADARLLESEHLQVDESLLTGESMPVRKVAWDGSGAIAAPGGDDLPFVYSGTLIVQGHGLGEVQATGARTALGQIGEALHGVKEEPTPLQRETRRLVRALAILGLGLCVVVAVVYGLTRGNWLDGLLAGITLAMSILPEEFPVVLTVFLALGAWRLATRQVLTRRVPVVETLGAATVLGVDKTGTLTLNRMAVQALWVPDATSDFPPQSEAGLAERFHPLLEYAILASQRDPFDPMERALHDAGAAALAGTEHLHGDWRLVREYPLQRALLALSHVWRSPDGADYAIAAKGAPEAIVELCHLDEGQAAAVAAAVTALAGRGLRVIGVARAVFAPGALPAEQHAFEFALVGLIGLADPVRPSAPAALAECARAGVRVVMITGDYPGTAQQIAREVGLAPVDRVLTGPELARLDEAALRARLTDTNIYARVAPEQKLRLVQALKANGEVVAMTGDGVNDAPALKAAHIGIAMGGRGTDVAREAAALVLLDDDFASIVQAVRQGRRIYDNVRKAMAYLLAIHVPIAGVALVPVLAGWPLVLMPVHVVFLELIIDPACSVVFEAEPDEADVMARPPRPLSEPLFSGPTVALSLLQGAGVLVAVLAVYVLGLFRGQGELEARALAFTTLIVGNLALIVVNRSWSRTLAATWRVRNVALWTVAAGALGSLAAVLYVPFLRDLFRFAPLHGDDLMLCAGAGIAGVVWFEGWKLWSARRGSGGVTRSLL